MNETTLTIIGMIAAFITASVTAFLAEPVKNHFADRAKLHHLRFALYTGLINNYYALTHFKMDGTNADSYTL